MYVLATSILPLILVCVMATALPRVISARLEVTQGQSISVGCPADGQAGPIEAPEVSAMTVPTSERLPKTVAYYKGEQAPGVFAPRGWQCHVWYGSGGGVLLVTPDAQKPGNGTAWPAASHEAVELTFHDPGASGRYQVAQYSLFFFHTRQEFRRWVEASGFGLSNPYEDFKNDSIRIRGRTIAEFTTPPRTTGFGTAQFLRPSADPIDGIVVLGKSKAYGEYLVVLRIRLGHTKSQLKTELLRLNRTCMVESRGCSTPE
jgi:hypothetical protein